MYSCLCCDAPTAAQVCNDRMCQKIAIELHLGDVVVPAYRKSPKVFEFLLETSIAAASSNRANMIFKPFPYYFKTGDTKYVDEPITESAPAGRDNVKMRTCLGNMRYKACVVANIVKTAESDAELFTSLHDNAQASYDMYQFLKFIVVTNPLDMTHSIIEFGDCGRAYHYTQYEIRHGEKIEAKFRNLSEEFCYLFHGSRLENWYSIIRNGIINASNTKLMTAGAAYGSGVYLSDNISVNVSYSERSSNNQWVIAVFEIAGNRDQYHKGRFGIGNVYVVNDTSRMLLRYLITVPKCNFNAFSDALEQRFNNSLQNRRKGDRRVDDIHVRRLAAERHKLESAGFAVEDDAGDPNTTSWNILTERGVVRVVFPPQYPFSAPIIDGFEREWNPRSMVVDFIADFK